MIEKMISAFYLLENLAQQKLDFIFKIVTSLILITIESNRFSVEIDISVSVDRVELKKVLNVIGNRMVFDRQRRPGPTLRNGEPDY